MKTRLLLRRPALLLIAALSGTGTAFAADSTSGVDANDGTERSPGETRPGRVPACNPAASNCDSAGDDMAPSSNRGGAQGTGLRDDVARPRDDGVASGKRRPSGIGGDEDTRPDTSGADADRGTEDGGARGRAGADASPGDGAAAGGAGDGGATRGGNAGSGRAGGGAAGGGGR